MEAPDEEVDERLPAVFFKSDGSLDCIGSPISVAELARRVFVPACAARLNICGMRALARLDEELPSGGCTCWKASNSKSSALRALRYSNGVELTSRIGGKDKPSSK
jgi:hypothetical protein